MPKEISDKEYFQLKVAKEHKPIIAHAGDQRDPIEFITCTCQAKPWLQTFDYATHLFEIIDREWHFLPSSQPYSYYER